MTRGPDSNRRGPPDPPGHRASRIGREPDQAKGLTAENLAAIRASACRPRELGGIGLRMEAKPLAEARGILDIAICSVMRDSLIRRSERPPCAGATSSSTTMAAGS